MIQPAFCPLSTMVLFDLNSIPLKGGKIQIYDAETTAPRTVYRDAALTLPHTWPVLTDGYGRIPVIWVGEGSYKIVARQPNDSFLYQVDDLPGATVSGPTPIPTGTTIPTGRIMASITDDVDDGWLLCNGLTLGNPLSAATARANDDCQSLFQKIWNKMPGAIVSPGGRGVDAGSDWAGAKTITLPDIRGRSLFGADGMGNDLAGLITALTTANVNQIGQAFGDEGATLSIDNLPTLTMTFETNSGGGHTPSGSADPVGNHQHDGTTDGGGSHYHTIANTAVAAQVGGTARGIFGGGASDQGTDTAGTHQHTFVTNGGGAHGHSLSMNPVNPHTHSGTTDPIGNNTKHKNMPPGVIVYFSVKL